jgi:prepilin-type N-terminal cleavage/methylation domain-containing protein
MAITKPKINFSARGAKRKKAGFTFIEILVSLAIFSIIMSVALGVLVSAIKSQERILAEQQLLNQTSYIMEYVSRSLRMAKKDLGGTCITQGYNYQTSTSPFTVQFLDYENKCTRFFLDTDKIIKIQKSANNSSAGFGSAVIYPLISDNFTVNLFKVTGSGWQQGDLIQPSVTFFIDISGKNSIKTQTQTTISQRNMDVLY